MVEAVVAHAIRNEGVDICLFCEITSDLMLSDITLSKQIAVTKRDRKKNSAQLGYGGIMADLSEPELTAFTVDRYTDLFEGNLTYRGGQDFLKQSKRKVAGIGQIGGNPLFMYHANSSYKSPALVRWVVGALDEAHDRFLLVGDFNCSPDDLRHHVDWGDFRIADGGPTHNAKNVGGPTTTLDYAVAKGLNPAVTVLNDVDFFREAGLTEMPDHLPIIVNA